MLLERGRVKSSLSFADWHDRVAQFPALPIEPLVWDDIREARGLEVLGDPFDRLIAGTAIRLDAPSRRAAYHRRRACPRFRSDPHDLVAVAENHTRTTSSGGALASFRSRNCPAYDQSLLSRPRSFSRKRLG